MCVQDSGVNYPGRLTRAKLSGLYCSKDITSNLLQQFIIMWLIKIYYLCHEAGMAHVADVCTKSHELFSDTSGLGLTCLYLHSTRRVTDMKVLPVWVFHTDTRVQIVLPPLGLGGSARNEDMCVVILTPLVKSKEQDTLNEVLLIKISLHH